MNYNYVKPKYDENAKLCYKDTDSFTVYVEISDIYKDNASNVKTRFDTKKDRSLHKGKKEVIGIITDELRGKS